MNLFGLTIGRANGKYVRTEECHRAQDSMHKRITEVDNHLTALFNSRIDDLKDFLLKK